MLAHIQQIGSTEWVARKRRYYGIKNGVKCFGMTQVYDAIKFKSADACAAELDGMHIRYVLHGALQEEILQIKQMEDGTWSIFSPHRKQFLVFAHASMTWNKNNRSSGELHALKKVCDDMCWKYEILQYNFLNEEHVLGGAL